MLPDRIQILCAAELLTSDAIKYVQIVLQR